MADRLNAALLFTLVTLVYQHTNALPTSREITRDLAYQSDEGSGYDQSDFTEINKDICPPSLCKFFHDPSINGTEKPKGTAGSVFFQGDMVLDRRLSSFVYKSKKTSRYRRATIKIKSRFWEHGVVKFEMDKQIDIKAKKVLIAAMAYISNNSCIVFKVKRPWHKDYIHFTSEQGCWAQVGRVGGKQLVNIGSGCENVGTATHEILHALGVLHEQARSDRDSYIRVLYENVVEKHILDFDRFSDSLITSLQHPYDYGSLMHYSSSAFSKNKQHTIEVIGIGDKLNVSIGQRRELSTIDIAQLREMYGCNKKSDNSQYLCERGWVKHQKSCYKFYHLARVQFAEGHTMCKDQGAHLLIVDSTGEENFIMKHSKQFFPFVQTWRTSGKLLLLVLDVWFPRLCSSKVDDRWVWYINETLFQLMSGYVNWETGHPGQYTSNILVKNRKTEEFKWRGEWAEFIESPEMFRHNFICEKTTTRKCEILRYRDGRDYRGYIDHTRAGHTCMKWTDSYPHNHTLVAYSKAWAATPEGQSPDGLGDHNKCRNPDALQRNRPWCYTTKLNQEWGYCNVHICN